MKSNKNEAVLNSITSVVAQVAAIVVSLYIRKYLVRLYDVEIVGMNGVFNELVSFLSLFELGISASIVYRLLAPILSNDKERILKLFIIIKQSYRLIGSIMIAVCVVCLMMLNVIISVETVSRGYVYFSFLILAVGTVSSFFISYYRTIFIAYQRQYFCNVTDLIIYCIFNVLKLAAIFFTKSFLLYLCFQTFQSVCGNLLIRSFCIKRYPFLKTKCRVEKVHRKELFADIKNISVSRLAGYVYSSTDSSIISAACGTVTAGYISNYKMIFSPLRNIINIFNTALVPTWGNYIGGHEDKKEIHNIFLIYTFFEYLISVALVIPTVVLIDEFVVLWIGTEYQISAIVTLLMGLDIFINAMQEPNVTVMNAIGYFRENKLVSEAATLLNVVVSIILAHIYGAVGVFIGTIFALIIFFLGRSMVIYKKFFQFHFAMYIKYLIGQVGYFLLFLAQLFGVQSVVRVIPMRGSVSGFLALCILCEMILCVLNICIWRKDFKYQYIKNMLLGFVKKGNCEKES